MGLRVSLCPPLGTSQEGTPLSRSQNVRSLPHKQQDSLGDLISNTVFTGVTLL